MRTAAREANNCLANAWLAVNAGNADALTVHLSAAVKAAQAANFPGLAGEIDSARQDIVSMHRRSFIAVLDRLWLWAENRCIAEEADAARRGRFLHAA